MSEPFNHHPILIVPAADRDRANAAAAALSGRVEDLATFNDGPLSPTGAPPATHYLAAPPLQEGQYQAAVQLHATEFPNGLVRDSAHDQVLETLETVLSELGLRRIEE